MSADLDLDLVLLVGEMEAPPCEHSQHGIPGLAHNDGPATHYIMSSCDFCDWAPATRSVCSAYVSLVLANGPMHCTGCGRPGSAADFITVLGPVAS
jgi:hypothetical protein